MYFIPGSLSGSNINDAESLSGRRPGIYKMRIKGKAVMAFASLLIFFALACPASAIAQSLEKDKNARVYTLEEIIKLVQDNSPLTRQAGNSYTASYWSYRTFQSNYLPQLSINATLPDFNRSIISVTQPDGKREFVQQSLSYWTSSLSLSQAISATGGSVFLNSEVYRLDNYANKTVSYQSKPGLVGINQPLFQYNKLRWDKKIEPLKYTEATRKYVEDIEIAAVRANTAFFDLLTSQVNEEFARRNMEATDTLFKISQGRYNLGKIAENELLQIELSLINSRQRMASNKLNVQANTLRLKTILGLTDLQPIVLVEPGTVPQKYVNAETAVGEARKNRSNSIGFTRRLAEADQAVAQALGNSGFTGNLYATFGYNKATDQFKQAYLTPMNQQQSVNLTFSLPILSWGRTKSIRRTAQANLDLVRSQVDLDDKNFQQEIYLLVQQFNISRDQLQVAIRASEIAQKRYDITKQRFLIGKIEITDLNIAQQEKDAAIQARIDALRAFWNYYYDLRRSTLYDFEADKPILHTLTFN
ncbi:MAG: TolC family protein [Bacteroidota bacterium]